MDGTRAEELVERYWLFGLFFRRIGWIKEGDLTLE